MLNNNSALKYETPYKRKFEITQCWTNDTVTFQCGAIKIRYNISIMKLCTNDTNIDDVIAETNAIISHSNITVIYFCLYKIYIKRLEQSI